MTLTVPFHGLHVACHYEPGRKRDPLPTDLDDEPAVFSIEAVSIVAGTFPEDRARVYLSQEFVDWLDSIYRDDIYDLAMEQIKERI